VNIAFVVKMKYLINYFLFTKTPTPHMNNANCNTTTTVSYKFIDSHRYSELNM